MKRQTERGGMSPPPHASWNSNDDVGSVEYDATMDAAAASIDP